MTNATLQRFGRNIRGHKFVNYMEKTTLKFASLRFLWVSNQVTNKFFKVQGN